MTGYTTKATYSGEVYRTGVMVVFFVGLASGIGGLVALYFAKQRRQQADYDEWTDEDEEEY